MHIAALLNRLAERVAEQEIDLAVEKARRLHQHYGYPFTEEDRASIIAFQRHKRTWPPGLDIEEQIQRGAAWYAPRLGVSVEDYIAEAERLVEEHDQNGCGEDCLLHE